MYPGAAPKRPPDQMRERQRLTIAKLGKPKGGEVVHGDDLRGARRGDDEVGAVRDVDGARPPLDPGSVGPSPQGAQWPCQHRSIDE